MGILTQPKVFPLPTDTTFKAKTAVVTGASAGMGLEAARQLLVYQAACVVLAVRNVAKGEACKAKMLADPAVKKYNPKGQVKVMKLDVDDYTGVQAFVKALVAEVPDVDLLLLNAGIGSLQFELAKGGHERVMQVNYFSNALLTLELLPHLEAIADRAGHPTRIVWVGSRAHYSTSFENKAPITPNESVIAHVDDPKLFAGFTRYNDSKLLCAMFMYKLAPLIDKRKVVLNMVCPGMVNTGMSDMLPQPLRSIVDVVKAIRARSVEQGVWLILNAALIVGPESHGVFYTDKNPQKPSAYIMSSAGQEVEKKLWTETLAEMSKLTTLPPKVAVSV
ncbi:hypothetical protein DV737_g4175, partial [Chaetothyriales sp. CBS 132003]